MANKKIDFEESIKKLEEIANELEKDDLTLDESVEKFEKGMTLMKACKSMLDDAEKRITILLGDQEQEFSPEE